MRILISIILTIFIGFNIAKADIKVVTTYPYIASIVKEIVKNKATVESLAEGNLDPHFIVPKPSLVVKLRNADLIIINGAGLEIGWLLPLINQASNPKINPSSSGFLDLSQFVNLIQKPETVSRSMGDVHPEGNPHFHLDPYNIPVIADVITNKLCRLDVSNCKFYESNNTDFKERWKKKLKEWNEKLSILKGKKVVGYHKLFDYFIERYNLNLIGTLEPLPGIPPNAKHTENLINIAKSQGLDYIFQDVYHSQKPAKFLAEKTGVRMIILPHDVGSIPEVKDIFGLFDEIVRRLTQ
ncbi:MAG: zinc ABC transporter substrate-binding protein [Hydrogenothermaceae bacterium]|nr:zinc ABC transporter substrate-binding protein [Hydrogenothermaceae bacterium]